MHQSLLQLVPSKMKVFSIALVVVGLLGVGQGAVVFNSVGDLVPKLNEKMISGDVFELEAVTWYHDLLFGGFDVHVTDAEIKTFNLKQDGEPTVSSDGDQMYVSIPINIEDYTVEQKITCNRYDILSRIIPSYYVNSTTIGKFPATILLALGSVSADGKCTGQISSVSAGYQLPEYTVTMPQADKIADGECAWYLQSEPVSHLTDSFYQNVGDAAAQFLTRHLEPLLQDFNFC